jgi:hypothetical protein
LQPILFHVFPIFLTNCLIGSSFALTHPTGLNQETLHQSGAIADPTLSRQPPAIATPTKAECCFGGCPVNLFFLAAFSHCRMIRLEFRPASLRDGTPNGGRVEMRLAEPGGHFSPLTAMRNSIRV